MESISKNEEIGPLFGRNNPIQFTLFHLFRFRVKRLKPSKVTVCYDSMKRLPCENNYPCVHGTCQLTLINTTFCFCNFPYNGETCNTTVLFWTTSFVLIISVAMILIILNVRFLKLRIQLIYHVYSSVHLDLNCKKCHKYQI